MVIPTVYNSLSAYKSYRNCGLQIHFPNDICLYEVAKSVNFSRLLNFLYYVVGGEMTHQQKRGKI